jgi:2-desacetyl-2-hydroxyethyl bacteriochlorophyllide A dehydrogenase
MSEMKAARFYDPNMPLKVERVPVPAIGPEEVLVEVRACGICGSDVHIIKGETFTGKRPIILGHEGAGVVSSVGEAVPDWQPGDRVVIDCVTSCANCFNCQRGQDSICLSRQLTGIHLDGALAQFIKVRPRNLIRLPPEIDFETGSLATDAVATPYHALKARAALQIAESVAIFGTGGLGFHAVKLARLMGATPIIAVDISETALERARGAGADIVINAQREDPPDTIRRLTEHKGVDVALECVGRSQTVRWAAESVRPSGRAVVVGLGPESVQLRGITEFVRHETSLSGSSAFEIKEIKEILSLMRSGRLDLGSSITKTVPLDQINEALRALAENSGDYIRIVVNRFQ